MALWNQAYETELGQTGKEPWSGCVCREPSGTASAHGSAVKGLLSQQGKSGAGSENSRETREGSDRQLSLTLRALKTRSLRLLFLSVQYLLDARNMSEDLYLSSDLLASGA